MHVHVRGVRVQMEGKTRAARAAAVVREMRVASGPGGERPLQHVAAGVLAIVADYARDWFGRGACCYWFAPGERYAMRLMHAAVGSVNGSEHAQWVAIAAPPESDVYPRAAWCGDRILMVLPSGVSYLYEPDRDIWADAATCRPQHDVDPAICAHAVGGSDRVYLFGNVCQVYESDRNAWRVLGKLPYAHQQHAAVVQTRHARGDNVGAITATATQQVRIVVCGGLNARTSCLDVVPETWCPVSDMLHQRTSHAICAAGEGASTVVLVIGGWAMARNLDSVHSYSMSRDTWSVATWKLPGPRSMCVVHALTDRSGEVILYGGAARDMGTRGNCVRINLASGRITPLPDLVRGECRMTPHYGTGC